MQAIRLKNNLASLIPIAVVVVGGCEPCAEKMVKQALAQGSSWQDIDETLRILGDMHKRPCVIQALGAETVARMEKPLTAARRTLDPAKPDTAVTSGCGCSENASTRSAQADQ